MTGEIIEEQELKIPVSIISKLYDSTGSEDGANKGYFLFYINEDGQPTLTSRMSNACVKIALEKTIQIYSEQTAE